MLDIVNQIAGEVAMESWVYGLIGGIMIGGSASLLLLTLGRIFGVSGILAGALFQGDADQSWRLAILAGLVAGGFMMYTLFPNFFPTESDHSIGVIALAGLMVGFGTQLGSGCTSGHGICGISRFSIRSLTATVTFVLAGIVTVALTHWMGG